MPLPSKPPLSEALRGSLAYAARAKEHLRAGLSDARMASLTPPQPNEHVRRFFFGFAMPLTLMRIAWSDAAIKASIRRRLLPPLLLVGVVATFGIADIVSAVVEARKNPTELAEQVADDKDDDDESSEGEATGSDDDKGPANEGTKDKRAPDPKDLEEGKANGEAIAKAVQDAKTKGGTVFDISAAAIQAAGEAEARERAKRTEAVVKRVKAAPPLAHVPGVAGSGAFLRTAWDFLTSKLAKLIVTLSVLEWILIWIGREHHDQIAYETAVLTGVPGEALAGPPRLRFDSGWLKLKGWRAIRLLIFFALAVPVSWLVGLIPVVGGALAVTIQGAWAAYWACVFAIGNSFLVWETKDVTQGAYAFPPWFVRVTWFLGRVPVLGIPFRLYSRVLARVTYKVWPACIAFEETTWESAGLALARTIASAPVVYIVTRPVFSPAATHAYVARVAPAAGTDEVAAAIEA